MNWTNRNISMGSRTRNRLAAGLMLLGATGVAFVGCGGDYEPVAAYHDTLVPAPTGLVARVDSVAGNATQVRISLAWSHPAPALVVRYQALRRDLSSAVPSFTIVGDTPTPSFEFLQNRPTTADSTRLELSVQAIGTEATRGFVGPRAVPVTVTIRKSR